MGKASIQRVLAYPSTIEWVCLFAGSLLALRYFWYMDDAFIYFRYVDNWVLLGRGLTFNQGEFVEGFSSPLWVLVLAPFRWAGMEYPLLMRLLAVATYALFWALAVRVNRLLSPAGRSVNLLTAFLPFCYAVGCYFTSGLESPLVQVLAVAFALLVLAPTSRVAQVLVGLGPLLRPELAVPWAIVAAWAWWRSRRFPLALVLTTSVSLGGWLVVRVAYYAELLPNTFYLKNEVDVAQGLAYAWDAFGTYGVHVLFALGVGLVFLLLRRGRSATELRLAERGVMLLALLSVAAYEVKIGGDARHYRVLAFPFLLTVCALGGLPEHALALLRLERSAWAAPAAALALSAVAFLQVPRQLEGHPITLEADVHQVDLINDAQWHRKHSAIASLQWMEGTTEPELRAYRREHPEFRYTYVRNGPLCANDYRDLHDRIVHGPGFTDALLARTVMATIKAGHKPGLAPLARDIVEILARTPRPAPGMYRAAVERGDAPGWVVDNLEAIEVIERKIYNRHDFLENLALCFAFPDRIVPRPEEVPAHAKRSLTTRLRIRGAGQLARDEPQEGGRRRGRGRAARAMDDGPRARAREKARKRRR